MIRFIRQFSQPILWAVVVIVIVSFSFWGSYSMRDGQTTRTTGTRIGMLGGKPLTQEEFAAAQRRAYQTVCLNQGRQVRLDQQGQQYLNEETWRSMLLQEEAARRGIRATDADIAAAVQRFPAFQNKEGAFDPARLQQFLTAALPALGMNQASFESMLRDQILTERVVAQLTAGTRVTDEEIKDQVSRLFARTTIETVDFKGIDYTSGILIPEDEIKKEYDAGAGNYSTPERRKVAFVRFTLTPDQQSLTNAARNTALNSVYDKASAFSAALAGGPGKPRPNFAELAQSQGLKVEQTGFFCADEPVSGVTESNAFMAAAYSLSPNRPDGDVVPGKDEFYVQHFLEVQPAQRLPLDQVKSRITATLVAEKASEAADKAAAEAATKLEEGLKLGKKFEELAASLKLTVKRPESFIPADTSSDDADSTRMIRSIAMDVPTGGISAVTPTRDGSLIVHVVSRDLKDPDPEKLKRLRQRMVEQKRSLQLREWFGMQMRDPSNSINLGPAPAAQTPGTPAAVPAQPQS